MIDDELQDVFRLFQEQTRHVQGKAKVSPKTLRAAAKMAFEYPKRHSQKMAKIGSKPKRNTALERATARLLGTNPGISADDAWWALHETEAAGWLFMLGEDDKLYMRFAGPVEETPKRNPRPIAFSTFKGEYFYPARKNLAEKKE